MSILIKGMEMPKEGFLVTIIGRGLSQGNTL